MTSILAAFVTYRLEIPRAKDLQNIRMHPVRYVGRVLCMIDLTRSPAPIPNVHKAVRDPGNNWEKLSEPSIDAPPDYDLCPAPDTSWPRKAQRSGLCGSVSPRVISLTDGTYRMYYTQILPRTGYPAGANDYDTSTSRILSARSIDGLSWTP